MSDSAQADELRRDHRRAAAALYGLIIAGSVLATAGAEDRLVFLGLSLVLTQGVYWAAETYVHLMAQRQVEGRPLPVGAIPAAARDGLPMISVSALPIALLFAAAVLGVPTSRAADIALYGTTVLLFLEGYRISRDAGVTGWRLFVASFGGCALGLVMVGLKVLLAH